MIILADQNGDLLSASPAFHSPVAAEGITPLDYLLGILRDEDQEQVARVHAAIAAAPYVHAKLSSSTVDLDAKPTMILQLLERPVEGK